MSQYSVLEAGNQGLETYILCPSVVYGTAAVGAKNVGVGYQLILENAGSLGFVPYIGNGSAILSAVWMPQCQMNNSTLDYTIRSMC